MFNNYFSKTLIQRVVKRFTGIKKKVKKIKKRNISFTKKRLLTLTGLKIVWTVGVGIHSNARGSQTFRINVSIFLHLNSTTVS